MIARCLVCLTLVGCSLVAGDGHKVVGPQHTSVPGETPPQRLVIVTVWATSAREPAVVEAYEWELATLMEDLGVRYRFSTLEEATSRSFSGRIVVLRMLEYGSATAARANLHELPKGALGWTHASGSDVTPFGAVDLPALRNFLERPELDYLDENASHELGRAIARVAAHEIFHMLTRSKTHSNRGVMKPGLTRAELLAERALRWTNSNRAEAQQVLPRNMPEVLAALSGEQSTAADNK